MTMVKLQVIAGRYNVNLVAVYTDYNMWRILSKRERDFSPFLLFYSNYLEVCTLFRDCSDTVLTLS
jgi:hypothetical protein